jgi:pimeloyl-ACP methyl ester carboxylesterase
MRTSTFIDGIEVIEEGEGDAAIVMIHGCPDTYRLWDATVAALQDRFRCVRFTLPGYDLAQPPRPTSVAAMTALIDRIVDHAGRGAPVTLLLHDWGCVFGYAYAMGHRPKVARLVGVDIGDALSPAYRRSLTARQRRMIAGYQLWLAAAWLIGGTIGNRMTHRMVRLMRWPGRPEDTAVQMNYPYAMRWFGACGGMRGLAPLEPHCPMLYLYGARKPFPFHSPAWAEQLAATPGCRVVPMPTGHWLMLEQSQAFNRELRDWLTGPAGRA